MTYKTILDLQNQTTKRIEQLFTSYFKNDTQPAPLLQEAMRYAVFNGGKRLRPLLIYATGVALDVAPENLDPAAAAIELMHCYSLVHDDLPAMDNSPLRRGKPTCHRVYGDAMAILVGDALQTQAFDLLVSHPAPGLTAAQRLMMVKIIAEASGPYGIAAGQTLDIRGVTDLAALTTMYHLKTSVLLKACVRLAAAAAVTPPVILNALNEYADALGLAFQIQDDILEIENDTAAIGKPQGLDAANNKVTYVSLIGIAAAKRQLAALLDKAIAVVNINGIKSNVLKEFAELLLHRKY